MIIPCRGPGRKNQLHMEKQLVLNRGKTYAGAHALGKGIPGAQPGTRAVPEGGFPVPPPDA
jgi:hypothetical protein